VTALSERGLPEAASRRPFPPFTEKHDRLRAEIRRFVTGELRPHAREWEDARWFPNDVFTRMAELGLLGLKYPRELGGRGGDHFDDAVLTEQLSRCGSGGLAAGIGAHIGIATPPIWSFGSEGQKQRFLRPAIRGEQIAALGITEPGAGSDVAGLRTFARRVDGGYVVNGSKTFITNGVRADFVVTAVKTTEQGGHQGLSFLIVERESEGFEVSRQLEKLGWHASDTGELSFSDVFVPEDNLLGGENRGFYLIVANFDWGAAGHGAGSRGVDGGGAGARGAGRRLGPASRRGRDRRQARGVALPDLPRAAALRRRPQRHPRGDRGEAALAARGLRGGRDRLSACWTATTRSPASCATRASAQSAAGTDEVMKEILGKQLGL
jgi:alkylation response protein AidB-like acyl-CoA dehydrogenase